MQEREEERRIWSDDCWKERAVFESRSPEGRRRRVIEEGSAEGGGFARRKEELSTRKEVLEETLEGSWIPWVRVGSRRMKRLLMEILLLR